MRMVPKAISFSECTTVYSICLDYSETKNSIHHIKTEVEKVREQVRLIYNARLKVERIATEIDQLAQYGTILPENMQGLNEDQIIDLKLKDPWTEKCIPSGGAIENKDIYNRRNGQRPNDNMVKILQDTITKEMVFQMNLSNLINSCIWPKN